MKTCWLLALLLAGHSTAAQLHKPVNARPGPAAGLVSQPPGELFVGEWEWSSGGEVFRVTLIRNPSYTSPRYPTAGTQNVVMGQYSYMRNGVVIDQSTATGPRPYALFGTPVDNSSMQMSFKDNAKGKYGKATVAFVPGNPNQLTWQLKPKEMLYIYPDVAPSAGFTVPTNVTLTRVP